MPLPDSIIPVQPRVVPAEAQKTFDKVRICSFRWNAMQPNRPVRLRVELVFCRNVGEYTVEDHSERIPFTIDDLFKTARFITEQTGPVLSVIAAATPEEAIGIALVAVQAAAEKYARAQEVI